ncbi:Sel1-like repeat-containing serine/threonine protein kinase [Actinoplanes sp. N902-109]|nr:Sel1-like repeat-containing serine/threonine protein kinase [Actinoplanes sp. N902-109]
MHPGPIPYEPRPHDPAIDRALTGDRRLTIVHGQRLAGASRSLAEAARRRLGTRTLLVPLPDPALSLHRLVSAATPFLRHGGEAVLWLDALHPALLDQLDPRLLREGLRICVTAGTETMTGTHVPAHTVSALSRYADIIAIHTRPRQVVVDPVRQALAGASVERRTLVRIVTDWARLGMPGRLDRGLLKRLYEQELPGADATRALAWAVTAQPRLVEPVPGGHLRPHPLLTVVQQDRVCDAVWQHACRTLDGADRLRVALSAYDRGEVAETRRWCETLADTGDPALAPVMLMLGSMALDEGDTEGARRWWQRTVDTDHPQSAPPAMKALGNLDHQDKEWDTARYWYHRALATGHADVAMAAMMGLATVEEDAGDIEAAEHWRRQVARWAASQ